MEYAEGIKINGLHSFIDFDLTIANRQIDLPPKTSIRKTVPFMNGYYDYSKINGAVCWGERQIQYTFDIVGDTVEQMDEKRTEVVNWLCNLHDVDIYDDTLPDYHFHGSFEEASQNEDGEKSELTVTFICHPFMISNQPTEMYIGGDFTLNNKGQPVRPFLHTSQAATITIGAVTQSLQAGETQLAIMLPNGETSGFLAKSNELLYPWQETTHTENGITFTVNASGTIKASGTATETAWFYLRGSTDKFKPPVGKHRFYGTPAGASASTFRTQVYAYHGANEDPVYTYDYGSGGVVDVKDSTEYLSIAIRISKGYTANNLTFNPSMYGVSLLYWNTEVL